MNFQTRKNRFLGTPGKNLQVLACKKWMDMIAWLRIGMCFTETQNMVHAKITLCDNFLSLSPPFLFRLYTSGIKSYYSFTQDNKIYEHWNTIEAEFSYTIMLFLFNIRKVYNKYTVFLHPSFSSHFISQLSNQRSVSRRSVHGLEFLMVTIPSSI